VTSLQTADFASCRHGSQFTTLVILALATG